MTFAGPASRYKSSGGWRAPLWCARPGRAERARSASAPHTTSALAPSLSLSLSLSFSTFPFLFLSFPLPPLLPPAADMPRVYIGRLSYHVREKDIQRFFSGYGRLLEVDLKNG